MLLSLTLVALLAQAAPAAPATNVVADAPWPSFRGASGSGMVGVHPLEWGADSNVAWRVDVPGGGWSSPVVAGGRVFVTTAIQSNKEDGGRPLGFAGGVQMPETRGAGAPKPTAPVVFELRAYALEDGALLWTRELAKRVPAHGIHPSNTFATETPATDGERVVCFFGALGLVACVDVEGEVLWQQEVGAYPTNADFGTGSSVALAEGLAFVQNDNEQQSFVAAFALDDGTPAWRVERPSGTSWSSPIVWERGDARDLVVCGRDAVTGYAPATGEVRWRVRGIGGTFSASPAISGERLFFGNSAQMRRGPLAALGADVDGEVDFEATAEGPLRWIVGRAGPGFSSPVAANGLVWVLSSQGILTCRDAATGEELYDERLPDVRNVVACPWTDGEHVFVLSEGGATYVVKAGREYELVATNELEGVFWSTPSAAGGSLLVRSADTLYCVRTGG